MNTVPTYPDISLRHCSSHEYCAHISRYLTPALLRSWILCPHIQISHCGSAPVMNTVHTYPDISLRHSSSHEYRTQISRYLTPALLQSWIPYTHIISHSGTAPVMNTVPSYPDISLRDCSSHEYRTHISRYLTAVVLQSWIPDPHIQISHSGTAPVMNTAPTYPHNSLRTAPVINSKPTYPDISLRHCSSHAYHTHISRYLTPALLQSWIPFPHIQISHSGTAPVMNTVPTYPDISLRHCSSHEYRTHISRYLTQALLQSWIPYTHIQISHSGTAPVMHTVPTYPDISLRHCSSHAYRHTYPDISLRHCSSYAYHTHISRYLTPALLQSWIPFLHIQISHFGTLPVMNTIPTYHEYHTHISRYLTPALPQSWIPYPHIPIFHSGTALVMKTISTHQDNSLRHCFSHAFHRPIQRSHSATALDTIIPWTHPYISLLHCFNYEYRAPIELSRSRTL